MTEYSPTPTEYMHAEEFVEELFDGVSISAQPELIKAIRSDTPAAIEFVSLAAAYDNLRRAKQVDTDRLGHYSNELQQIEDMAYSPLYELVEMRDVELQVFEGVIVQTGPPAVLDNGRITQRYTDNIGNVKLGETVRVERTDDGPVVETIEDEGGDAKINSELN